MKRRWNSTNFAEAPIEIIDGDRGKNYPQHTDFADEGFCVFLNAGNVSESGFSFSNVQFIEQAKDDKLRKGKLKRDDVVMTTRGTIGNVAHYAQNIPFENVRINSGMVIFRCDLNRLLPQFLYHFLRTPYFHGQMNSLRSGVAQPQLPIRDIKRIELPLPSLTEQSRIAEHISAYDELMENNQRRMELLEESARLLYREWFVRLRFPGHEHSRVTNGVPEGWEGVPFEDALVLQRGFDLPEREWQEGEFPICGSTGIIGHHKEPKAKGPGVFTGRSGSLGVVNYVEDDYWPHNTALWVREFKKVTPLFALFLLREMNLEQYNGGVSVPTLDRKAVHRVPVLIPPQKFITLFDELLTPMFAQVRNLRQQNQKLRAARNLLLPRLMSGEIAV